MNNFKYHLYKMYSNNNEIFNKLSDLYKNILNRSIDHDGYLKYQNMSLEQAETNMLNSVEKKYLKLSQLLTPYEIGLDKQRIGDKHDGGYVIFPELISKIDRCYTYGVGNDYSFETELVKLYPYKICHMYDHTVSYPETVSHNIFFKKEGLMLLPMDDGNTFENHLIQNNDQNKKILLKIDIEGAEWSIFLNIDDKLFDNVVVMVVEFHWLCRHNQLPLYESVFEKINKYFTLCHIHANNCGYVVNLENNKLFPGVVEATYVNNKYIDDKKIRDTPYPSHLDSPNDQHKPDIILNYWLRN